MYFKKLKDCLEHQKKYGGTIWYDPEKRLYYIIERKD